MGKKFIVWVGLACAVMACRGEVENTLVAQSKSPGCFSRDKGMRTFACTNGVFELKHVGRQDWAVTLYPEIKVTPGDRFTYAANAERLDDGSVFHTSVVLRYADGRIEWGYALKDYSSVGRGTSSFLVPSGVKTVQPRFGGRGAFAGRVSGLEFRRAGRIDFPDFPEFWTLGNERLEVRVHRDGGRFAVKDLKSGRDWATLKNVSVPDVRAVGVRRADNRIELDLFHFKTQCRYQASFTLDGAEVVAELKPPAVGDGTDIPASGINFPAPLAPAETDALVAPLSEGYRLPLNEVHPRVYNPSAWSSALCMPFFGIVDARDAAGWMAILETPNDARMGTFYDDNGRLLGATPCWEPSLGAFGYARRVRFVFFAEGGYVAMAKRYRAAAQKEGLVRTFREKVKRVPQLDVLVGAPNIWYFRNGSAPSHLELAKELRAAGFERMLWSQTPSTEEAGKLVALGNVLASRYDVYRDVYRPEMFTMRGVKPPRPEREICSNTSAWPDDVILTKAGDTNSWKKAWPITINGEKVHSAAMCTLMKPKYLRRNLDIELKRAAYNCRFIDVTAACGWDQCWSDRHRMTRTQSRGAAEELLGLLGREYGLVAGSEQGIGALVPQCDYFEGMLSSWYARMPHGRPGGLRGDIFREKTNVTEKELARVAKYGVDGAYRIPLFELVFHDCCCAHWYWYDYSNRPISFWLRRDLLNVLYGTSPMYIFDHRHWVEHRDEFIASYRRVAPIARRVGYSEMLDHRSLDPARKVQRTTFADGTTVVVNFGETPFTLPDGSVVAPLSFK